MKFLKVKLWGKEIGRLVWEANTRRTYFTYAAGGDIPDIAPLLSPAATRNQHLPISGDERPLYQGLPPFIADSLPDAWGNTLFEQWVRKNKIPRNQVTPLYKLMFIGKRGMGALEYEPCASVLNHTQAIDIKSLYATALKVLNDREDIVLNMDEELTLQSLLAVGTSPGGRQMKAVIAINRQNGEIRSGQTDALGGYDYYLLKFGNKSMPIAEIETAYYHMATDAGVMMEECRLFSVEGINHFLARRFDRRDGKKLHMQTLAAINPEARSYEELIATCRELSLPESEIERVFVLMVFNVMANNTDDHNKNFSFLLDEGGRWRMAPAYDMTFIFNPNGTGPNIERRMSIGGKTSEIAKEDLLEFAARNGIKNVNAIMKRVAEAVSHFGEYAESCHITQPWRSIIRKTLDDNLAVFGYKSVPPVADDAFHDRYGRSVSDFAVTVNAKGHYRISVNIDGNRRQRFVRPGMPSYAELSQQDIYSLATSFKTRLTETLLPPE